MTGDISRAGRDDKSVCGVNGGGRRCGGGGRVMCFRAGHCTYQRHTIQGMIQIGGFELMNKELRFNEPSGCMGPLQVPRILTF